MKHILISCLYGDRFKKLYPPVSGYECFFFSNNPIIESEAKEKGWQFILTPEFNLSESELISSVQAKYIKFLQFLKDYEMFQDVTEITYFDHKFYVEPTHIETILKIYDNSRHDLLIRNTPRLKNSIDDEISDAMHQERYKMHMRETINWLEYLIEYQNLSKQIRIMNTGIIHYGNIPKIQNFLDDVYANIVKLNQPECQIIFAALCQLNNVCIKAIDWDKLNPVWCAPE